MRITLACAVALTAPVLVVAQGVVLPFDAPRITFPYSISVTNLADFDGDARPDFAGWYWDTEGDYTRAHLQLMLNDGSGTSNTSFGTSALTNSGLATQWAMDVGPIDAVPGDDVAFAFDGQVTIYRTYLAPQGGATALLAAPHANWTEPFQVPALKLVDLDHDGALDLALVGAEVRAYRNTGTGFALMGTYPLSGTEMLIGDADGDGFGDIILPRPGVFEILRWNGTALQHALTIQHGVMPNEDPMCVCGDIDGDGDADLAVFTDAGTYVVARCISSLQFGVESRRIGGPATGLADIDGDGDLDGVCCGGGGPGPAVNIRPSTFHIAMNRGGGDFAPAITVEGLGAYHLAGAADTDGDGNIDLIAGRATWYGRGSFGFDTQPDMPRFVVEPPIVCSDVDGDGDPDISLVGQSALRNDGSGVFTPSTWRFPTPPIGTTFEHDGIRGDFDGDGDEDRIVVHLDAGNVSGMRLLLNLGGGAFADGGYATTSSMLDSFVFSPFDRKHVVADFDGDGDLDVFTGSTQPLFPIAKMWWNDGQGHFVLGPTTANPGVPMATADFDADGHVDVVTNHGIWFGNGQGAFALGFGIAPSDINPLTDTLAIGDLNGDGRLDLAYYASGSSYAVRVITNLGNRSFSAFGPLVFYSDPNRDHGTAIVDFDDDGDNDLFVWPGPTFDGPHSMLILVNDGHGNFPVHQKQIVDVSGPFVDVDGDGDLDAVGKLMVTRGAKRQPVRDGFRLQYGTSTASHAGFAPTLGASGTLAAGAFVDLRLTGATGGSPVALAIGSGFATIPDWPLPGLPGLVASPVILGAGMTDGASGVGGVGDLTLHLQIPAALSGATLFHQAYILDLTAPEIVATNGLMLIYR